MLPLDATDELASFFAGILTGAANSASPALAFKNKGAGALKIVYPG